VKRLFFIAFLSLICIYTSCERITDSIKKPSVDGFTFYDPQQSANGEIDSLSSDFEHFRQRVHAQKDLRLKQLMVDSLIKAVQPMGIPYTEHEILAHFLFLDSSGVRVDITGDFNNWAEKGTLMQRLDETNLYYHSARFPASARFEYKLRVNGILMRDPLNSLSSCYGDFSRNSELRMPFYAAPPEIESYDIPQGTIKVLQDLDRSIQVYLPPGYMEGNRAYPCAYFHDGTSWLTIGLARNVLDYLIYHKKIQPIIAVFIDPRNRDEEYYYGYSYIDTFVSEIIPVVENKYAVDHKAENRAVLGYSLGGLSTLLIARHHPQVIGNCAAFSPAIFTGDLINSYQEAPYLSTKYYIDAGTYEDWIYDPSLELANIMAGKKYSGRFYTWYEYHSFCSWRAHLDEALIYFYGI
jgi:enterochelin esterase-like enzyme